MKNHIVKLVKKSSHVLHELEIVNAKIKYIEIYCVSSTISEQMEIFFFLREKDCLQ